jgi:chromosome segregation ATPase
MADSGLTISENVIAREWRVFAMSEVTVESEMFPEVAESEVTEEVQERGQEATLPEALALSVDEFAALEERVLRAVNLVKRERVARVAAEEQAQQMEAKLAEHAEKLNQHETHLTEHLAQVDQLQGEVKTLRAERDHVRQRVERLLSQLDALEI